VEGFTLSTDDQQAVDVSTNSDDNQDVDDEHCRAQQSGEVFEGHRQGGR